MGLLLKWNDITAAAAFDHWQDHWNATIRLIIRTLLCLCNALICYCTRNKYVALALLMYIRYSWIAMEDTNTFTNVIYKRNIKSTMCIVMYLYIYKCDYKRKHDITHCRLVMILRHSDYIRGCPAAQIQSHNYACQ